MPGRPADGFSLRGQDAFEALSAALADAVFVLNRDGDVAYAGPGLRHVVGLDPADVEGRPFLDLVHPDDAVQAEDGGFWTSALPFEREFRMRSASGGWVWVRAVSEATDADGERPDELRRVLGDRVLLLVRNRMSGEEVRDADDLAQRAFDAVNNLVVVTDVRLPDNPIVVVNQNFLDTTGYERGEVLGQNCRFLQIRPDGTRDEAGGGQDEALEALREAVRLAESRSVVLRNYKKDGSLFYNRLYVTPVRDGAGAVTHFIGVQNDVTDEVRMTTEVAGQRRVLQAFFDSAPFLMGVLELHDGGLRHRAANPRAVEVFREVGIEFDAVEGRTLAELGFTEAEAETWRRHVERCAATGASVRFDTTFPWGAASGSDGALDFAVVVNATDGPAPIFSYVAEDVTEKHAKERERRLLAAAVEQAAEAILVTGPEVDLPGPRILYANRAHVETFGYTLGEVLGQSPRMFQGPKTDRGVLDRIRRKLETGEPVQAETVNYRKDGTEIVLEWEIAPVKDAAGRVVNWVGTQRDVTERRQLEHEVLEVAGREQERLARELHDGLGQVLTGSSIKLHVLQRALEALGEPALAADAARAGELVSEALEQARAIAHGLFPVNIEPDGLMVALERLSGDARDTLGVECTFAFDKPVVLGSAEQAGHLYRVVQEALTNAVRHGRARSVHVQLSDEDDGLVALTVQDDGVGIPDEALEGTRGLGMRTMAYRARRVGGTFDVRRLEAGGTAVRVRFTPVAPDPALVAEESSAGTEEGA